MGQRRHRHRAVMAAAALVAAASGVSCAQGSRSGALSDAQLPKVSCTAGIDGAITLSDIPSTLSGARISWNFENGENWTDGLTFVDPTHPDATPPASITLSAPPWSSTKDSSLGAPWVSVLYVAKDSSPKGFDLGARSYNCTKGSDSPTPTISCSHTGPGTVGEKGTVYLTPSSISSLGSNAARVGAQWWWKAIPLWEVILQPWLGTIVASWTEVVFAENTNHTLPGTASKARTGTQEFSSTPDLDFPSEYAGAYIGHVRVEVQNDQGRPVAFPAEADC